MPTNPASSLELRFPLGTYVLELTAKSRELGPFLFQAADLHVSIKLSQKLAGSHGLAHRHRHPSQATPDLGRDGNQGAAGLQPCRFARYVHGKPSADEPEGPDGQQQSTGRREQQVRDPLLAAEGSDRARERIGHEIEEIE